MACDGRLVEPRTEISFVINDSERGRVKFQVYDRISVDDVTMHLIERRLFQLAGGGDAGDDVNRNFKDFLVRENYLEII